MLDAKRDGVDRKSYPPRVESKEVFNASWKQLSNWAGERTLSKDNSSAISKLKEEFTPIGAERNARRSIVFAMAADSMAKNLDLPYVTWPLGIGGGPSYEHYSVFGDPANGADIAMSKVDELLKAKGFDKVGEITVQKADTITGEPVMVTVGKGEDGGQAVYYGEERNSNGEIISRTVIDTHRGVAFDKFRYRLELHFNGGRYTEQKAEVDVDSGAMPRATIKTMELLTGSVIQGLEE